MNAKMDRIYCRGCGASLVRTVSWDGRCLVCAEPYVTRGSLDDDHPLVTALTEILRQHSRLKCR